MPRLPKHVRRHGLGFRAVLVVNGERHRSPVLPTIAEAAAYARAVRDAARRGADLVPTLGVAWQMLEAELAATGARPATLAYYVVHRRTVARVIADETLLHEIDEPMLQRYAARRIADGVTPRVVWHKEIQALGRAIGVAERAGLVASNAVRKARKPTNRQRGYEMLTPQQIDEALAAIRSAPLRQRGAARDADVIELSFALSLRRAELSRLRSSDVDFAAGRLRVDGKNSDTHVPISTRARPVLERLVAQANGGSLCGSERQIEAIFARWSKRLGVRLTPQVMRHSLGSALARAGTEPWIVQEVMRHRDLRTTRKYVHEMPDRARAALDALLPGQSAAASREAPEPPSGSTRSDDRGPPA